MRRNVQTPQGYEYFLQAQVCRFCWSEDGGAVEIFSSPEGSREVGGPQLVDKIHDCLGLDLDRNIRPIKICESCSAQIESFYKFKKFCIESDQKLKEIFEKHSALNNIPNVNKVNREIACVAIKMEREMSGPDINEVKNESSDDSEVDTRTPLNINRVENEISSAEIINVPAARDTDEVSNEISSSEIISVKAARNLAKANGESISSLTRKNKILATKTKELQSKIDLITGYVKQNVKPSSKPKEKPETVFECKTCSQSFNTSRKLRHHVSLRHGEKFVCEVCGREFSRHSYLREHTLLHTGERPHQCPHCPYTATQRGSLVIHLRHHTKDRPYQCEFCPQRCTTKSNLNKHRLLRHTKERPTQCPICQQEFRYGANLKKHIVFCHEQPPSSYFCDSCKATYRNRKNLLRHIRAKHQKEIPIIATSTKEILPKI